MLRRPNCKDAVDGSMEPGLFALTTGWLLSRVRSRSPFHIAVTLASDHQRVGKTAPDVFWVTRAHGHGPVALGGWATMTLVPC